MGIFGHASQLRHLVRAIPLARGLAIPVNITHKPSRIGIVTAQESRLSVVVVGNEKGGCGKTTISVNIAAAAAIAGRTVLLVDADPGQQSSSRWASVRRERHPNAPAVRCVSLTSPHVTDELADLSKHYSLVVVDTGAEDSPQLRGAAVLASVLVVPAQPDELDLWTLPTMATMYAGAKRHNPNLHAVIVLNRVPHQTAERLPGEIRGWIIANAPAFKDCALVPLIGRAAYGRSSGDGLGVAEPAPHDAKAAAEIQRLYTEVMTHDEAPKVLGRRAGRRRQSQ